MIEWKNRIVTIKKQCELLSVARGSMYYKPKMNNNDDTDVMNELRTLYGECPSYGYRKMTVALRKTGMIINHKKVQRLLNIAGIKAIYPAKKTSSRNSQHKIFPYLLRELKIERPNQVWQVDITYIKMKQGFVYLFCLIDVFSRKIMGWAVSTFLDTALCLSALNDALKHFTPEIVNSDQGCQFTSHAWVNVLQEKGIAISMDGKGRWADNAFIERLWRTIKYESVYLHEQNTVEDSKKQLARFITFYNQHRFHQALNYNTPDAVFASGTILTKKELFAHFSLQQSVQLGVTMI
jgi:putative transposase